MAMGSFRARSSDLVSSSTEHGLAASRPILLLVALIPYAILGAPHSGKPALTQQKASHSSKVSFSRDVATIFKAHCFSCHSGGSPSGRLDLSSAAGVKRGGASGSLIRAGDAKGSLLLKRIDGSSPPQMPMGMPPLASADVATISAWITQGANFDAASTPVHWAYVPPKSPRVPETNSNWVRNPIDGFVLAKLKKEGLHPSPEASKETLIRRVTLDLTGLPPTLAEIDAFLADKSPKAYEKVVDRLLLSPHYGERQARGWLDLARYADTDGYEKDLNRTAWEYRDWVINAFNANIPYDQFTIDQIAGDLLPNATVADKVATGFHRNTMQNLEGGVDQAEAHFAVVLDRAETTATVWLGSTLGCARCHDHKYDPFTQRDYYKMVAFYSNTAIYPRGDKKVGEEKWFESQILVPDKSQAKQTQELLRKASFAEAALASGRQELHTDFENWKLHALDANTWTVLRPNFANSANGTTLKILKGGIVQADGANPAKETFSINLPEAPQTLTGIELEAVADPSLPSHGPGRAENGNFVLSRIEISADGKPVPLAAAKADYSQEQYSAENVLKGNAATGWAVNGQTGSSHQLILSFAKPVPIGSRLDAVLDFQSPFRQHVIGRFRISATTAADPLASLMPQRIRDLLSSQKRTTDQEKQLNDYFLATCPQMAAKRAELASAKAALETLRSQIPTALVMEEQPAKGPITAWVRHRGEFLSKTEEVTAGTPAVLPPLKNPNANRLDLARWIVRKDNPLTARVEVNRIWEQYFGRGIVETSEDFGTRCSPPTHPELLDWLACEFMAKNWDMKAIHRLIVTSATYRQSSNATPALLAKDPQNLLLARGPRFRLEAEMIHDEALASGGLLNPKVGGPSVFPYQPDGIWDSPYSGEQWMTSKGADGFRRGIYTFWKRTAPYPSFMAFDATSREACTVRRIRTNTPLQALAMLNDALMLNAAKSLGKRMEAAGSTDDVRLTDGFRLCTARRPKPAELQRLKRLVLTLKARFASRSGKLLAPLGDNPTDAAYTMVGNVLLNLDETLTKG